ncbi:origin recognition complex subunit 1 [Saccharomycopsis crataegensis]|uniref:Origin recognition complex subunit 1 n=1 Tax=Saccharomycopsis crataegensis TaxID=43959 RepID=A0AAV5QIN4_9ASCO|nr:origin recognition complex subunit 1 [Saccharomycopsis crataegensis]
MAHTPADFQGWEFGQRDAIFQLDGEETSKRVRASRRSSRMTRGKQGSFRDDPFSIILKRGDDNLVIQSGDCILYNERFYYDRQNHKKINRAFDEVLLIKNVRLNTDEYVDVSAISLKTNQFVFDAFNGARVKSTVDLDTIDDQELFISPKQKNVYCTHIIKKIDVYSFKKYQLLKDKQKRQSYFCQRAIDATYFSQAFDYEELLEDLMKNVDKFSQFMKKLLYDENEEYLKSIRKHAMPTTPKKPKKPFINKSKLKTMLVGDELESPPEEGEDEPSNNQQDGSSSDYEMNEGESSESDVSMEDVMVNDDDDDEGDDYEDTLASTRRTRKARRTQSPKKSRKRLKKKKQRQSPVKKSVSESTPSIPSRVLKLEEDTGDIGTLGAIDEGNPSRKRIGFQNAKEQLHTSTLGASLPCREEEFAQLYLTLESLITQQMGSCIYISGTPGTGKTATIRKVVSELVQRMENNEIMGAMEKRIHELEAAKTKHPKKKSELSTTQIVINGLKDIKKMSLSDLQYVSAKMSEKVMKGEDKAYEYLDSFDYVEINGLKLISPNACYEILWEKISGKRVSANSAKNLIESYLSDDKNTNKRPLVVLMDEIDQIITKNQSIMYNFFNWPTYPNSKLIVIAIANTMDLPERVLTNKISSRLGLTRLLFPGYTHDQLSIIIDKRISNMNKKNDSLQISLRFEKSAIEFASRKVASVSGDARRGLSICRRAVEIAEEEYVQKGKENSSKKPITDANGVYYVRIHHVIKAIQETTYSPTAVFVMNLSVLGKILLAAILRRQKFTGFPENEMNDIIDEMKRIINMEFLNVNDRNLKSGLIKDKNIFEAFFVTPTNQLMGLQFLINQLVEAGVITQEENKANKSRLVKLCIPDDEVHNALRKEKMFQKILG